VPRHQGRRAIYAATYAERRVAIREAVALGYEYAEITLNDFLAAIPDVPPGARKPGRPRRVIVPPPSSD
jgi:hypothetical protein